MIHKSGTINLHWYGKYLIVKATTKKIILMYIIKTDSIGCCKMYNYNEIFFFVKSYIVLYAITLYSIIRKDKNHIREQE